MDEIELKSTKRALRRHHKSRMKSRAVNAAKTHWFDGFQFPSVDAAIKNADHLKSCSCSMCCNPRRSGWSKADGKTAKEILAERFA